MLYRDTWMLSLLASSAVLIGFTLYRLVVRWIENLKRPPYPPGPKAAPVVGNMFDFPTTNAAFHYVEWGKKYNSDILHASTLGNHVVVLNSLADAEELLERRSDIYSDRMDLPIIKLLDLDGNMGFMPQGPEWKMHRRLAQQHFRLDTLSAHHPIQLRRVHVMLQALLEDPRNFSHHIQVLSISIPLASMYGYDVASDLKDPFVMGAKRALEIGDPLLTPLSTLVNSISALGRLPAWIPGATTQKLALEHRNLVRTLKIEPMAIIKEAVNNGTATPSVFSKFLASRAGTPRYEEEEGIMGSLALTIYGGTSDTTISAIGTIFYILATHPHIQRKAQEEIDQVVGRDRLPDFEDRGLLPYTDAIYHEALRWRPPTMLGIPHRVREDDHYKGYLIPRGSAVFANIWAMTHDETRYSDPYAFKPERFLNEYGKLEHTRILTYGFGRRLCIGRHIASSTLWLVIASLLSCFDIHREVDEFGKEIEIMGDYEDVGVVCHKKPFRCAIIPRFDRVPELIKDAVVAEMIVS